MPLNEPKNPALSPRESTEAPPTISPAEHRANRQHEANSQSLAENFAKALNEGVKRGEMPGV